MHTLSTLSAGLIIAGAWLSSTTALADGAPEHTAKAPANGITSLVNNTIAPLMEEYDIPGMAVALSFKGETYLFDYGMANREKGIPVDEHTLFELGSLSKLFTATLAAEADARGALSLNEQAGSVLDELAGSAFDDITLLELATYTAGGLPLQFPDQVNTEAAMLSYFQHWQPEHAPGTHRRYSNPSIGLLGYLVAQRLQQPYTAAVHERVLAPLGLENTHFTVPPAQESHYAYGYSPDNTPIRVNPGMLDAQAYGLKSTAADVAALVNANMNSAGLKPALRDAMAATRAGYATLGPMTQGLGWERYAYPVTLDALLAGNAMEVVLNTNKVVPKRPALPAAPSTWLNKTGATNGFGNYVAFVPGERVGIVLLANRNYPGQARIKAAYRILSTLTDSHAPAVTSQ